MENYSNYWVLILSPMSDVRRKQGLQVAFGELKFFSKFMNFVEEESRKFFTKFQFSLIILRRA